jgi:hypothetical protein
MKDICEVTSLIRGGLDTSEFFEKLNKDGIARWSEFICYGVRRGEFKKVNVPMVVDVILYSYQGVRMWSRVTPLGEDTTEHIINMIRE